MSLATSINVKSSEEFAEKLVEQWEELDEDTIEGYARLLKNRGVYLVPTLALFRSFAKRRSSINVGTLSTYLHGIASIKLRVER